MKFWPFLSGLLLLATAVFGADLRIGIIGCDTSHAVAFTEILNDSKAQHHVPGGKVVAAYKGGSPDIAASWSRVDGFSKTLRQKYKVKFYPTIDALCANVDAVLLESVDGRPHLAQVKPVLKARKPVFIDKPMAASLGDVIEIFRLAKEANVAVFSASSLRYGRNTQAVRHGAIGKVIYAQTSSPCELEPHHPDLFWYGVHGVESLFTVMGTGCQTVQRGLTPAGKIEVTGVWTGGRKGVFKEDKGYHGFARGDKGQSPVGSYDGYAPLVSEIMKFFRTGVAPVKPEETIEIYAFMEAADQSKREGGIPIRLQDVLLQAQNAHAAPH
jgi:Oxidoreductase family, NAD-binding Rossmann fold